MQAWGKTKWALMAFVLIGLATLGALFSGRYDIAVTAPHWPPVEWALHTAMTRSVQVHADEVVKPDGVDLLDPEFAARGFGHYSAACRTCHGAPGLKADPWMVIYPPAPELTRPEVTEAWTDEELFWILKNGIKDTGMMALGPTHKDADIWAVTAFVRQLPRLSPERYRELAARQSSVKATTMKADDPGHEHHH